MHKKTRPNRAANPLRNVREISREAIYQLHRRTPRGADDPTVKVATTTVPVIDGYEGGTPVYRKTESGAYVMRRVAVPRIKGRYVNTRHGSKAERGAR